MVPLFTRTAVLRRTLRGADGQTTGSCRGPHSVEANSCPRGSVAADHMPFVRLSPRNPLAVPDGPEPWRLDSRSCGGTRRRPEEWARRASSSSCQTTGPISRTGRSTASAPGCTAPSANNDSSSSSSTSRTATATSPRTIWGHQPPSIGHHDAPDSRSKRRHSFCHRAEKKDPRAL